MAFIRVEFDLQFPEGSLPTRVSNFSPSNYEHHSKPMPIQLMVEQFLLKSKNTPSQKPTSTQLILERKNICGLTLHVMDRFSLNNVQRNIKNKSKKQNNQAPH